MNVTMKFISCSLTRPPTSPQSGWFHMHSLSHSLLHGQVPSTTVPQGIQVQGIHGTLMTIAVAPSYSITSHTGY